MLLYDEGAHFKAHQDSEKAPRMFGTLVIALPSYHQGGEVVVTHAGRSKTFETSKSSDYGFSYLTWFSDVTHEVKPVTSGRRLVLTYNLVHTAPGTKQSAANSLNYVMRLTSLLNRWKAGLNLGMPTTLAYLFEHQYTDTSLCYDALKGHDQQVMAHLKEACAAAGFSLYLANLERSVVGDCDGSDDDDWYGYGRYRNSGGDGGFHTLNYEHDKTLSLETVVELSGIEVARDMDFEEDMFVQTDPFEDAEPDDEDYSGFTGNEGVTATHFYHRTAAILMPRSHRVEFFLAPKEFGNSDKKLKLSEWIDRLTNDLILERSAENSDDIRAELEQICEMVVRLSLSWSQRRPGMAPYWNTAKPPFSEEEMIGVLNVIVDLDKEVLFRKMLPLCSGKFSRSMFQTIGTALARYHSEDVYTQLSSHISKITAFSDRDGALSNIYKGMKKAAEPSEISTEFLSWLRVQYLKALKSAAFTSARDGERLAKLAKRMTKQQDIFDKVLPVVKANVNNTSMAVAFLVGIYDADNAGVSMQENVTQTVFKDVISDLVDYFSLTPVVSLSNKTTMPTGNNFSVASNFTTAPQVESQTNQNVALLLCYCLSLGCIAELDRLVMKLSLEAEKLPKSNFDDIHLPFLKSLLGLLQSREVNLKDSHIQRIYQMILASYVVRFVGPEPIPPKDLRRAPRGCGCVDCRDLDNFLVSPIREVGRFSMAQRRRQHLEQRLISSGHAQETERWGSPQTLVVTKRSTEYHSDHQAWATRCAAAKRQLERIGLEQLEDLLGDISGAVTSMNVGLLKAYMQHAKGSGPEPLSSGNGNRDGPLSPISRRKVPTEVVVIDD